MKGRVSIGIGRYFEVARGSKVGSTQKQLGALGAAGPFRRPGGKV